jgi:hypothetical protein
VARRRVGAAFRRAFAAAAWGSSNSRKRRGNLDLDDGGILNFVGALNFSLGLRGGDQS